MGRFEVDRKVKVCLMPIAGKPEAILVVEDDSPEGFKNLAHAYTLFAESYKKADAEKRGRFNLGEKLVLALAVEAEISTTKGTVVFKGDERSELRRKTAPAEVTPAILLTSDGLSSARRRISSSRRQPRDSITFWRASSGSHGG